MPPADPESSDVRPPNGAPLAFRSLLVDVQGTVPGSLASRLLADWGRAPVPWPVRLTCTLSVLTDEKIPDGARVLAHTQQGPLEFRQDGETYRTPGLSFATSPGGAAVALGPVVAPAALLLAFTEVQRAAGLLPLHAAVLQRDGQTVAVSGPSGAGKSTAALRLLGKGWALVAEDWAWLRPDTLEVIGWDTGLRLRPESLQRFAPEWLTAPTDEHGKHLLAPVRPGGVHTLNAFYFLSTGPASTPAYRVRAVWEMVGLPLTPAARLATQSGVNRLIRDVPTELIDRDALIERLG